MLTLLIAAVLNGDPPMLTTGPTVEAQLKGGPTQVVLGGTVERASKGKKAALVIVLDDGTTVWLTDESAFEPLLGKFVRVEGKLQQSMTLGSPGKPVELKRELSALVDRPIRLVGTAENAKGGAVVLVDGTPVYVAKKDSWPEALRTKRISLGGKLTRAQYLPQATVNAKGEISQGTSSASSEYVLRDATEPTAF